MSNTLFSQSFLEAGLREMAEYQQAYRPQMQPAVNAYVGDGF